MRQNTCPRFYRNTTCKQRTSRFFEKLALLKVAKYEIQKPSTCRATSFGRCFAFFTLHDQLDPQQKHLLQVEEMQRSDWLICQSASKFVARQVVSLMKNEQQSQYLLHKKDPQSTFCNNFLQPNICCATS